MCAWVTGTALLFLGRFYMFVLCIFIWWLGSGWLYFCHSRVRLTKHLVETTKLPFLFDGMFYIEVISITIALWYVWVVTHILP